MALWNCGGLTQHKADVVRKFMALHRPAALVLTETHRQKGGRAQLPRIEGYASMDWPLDGDGSGRGGGLAIFTRLQGCGATALPAEALPGFNTRRRNLPDTTTQMDGMLLRLHGHARPIALVAAYVQPGSHGQVTAPLTRQVRRLAAWAAARPTPPHILLCGDFNIHTQELGGHTARNGTAAEHDMFDDLGEELVCVTAELAHAAATHHRGGVLDLFWEGQPAQAGRLVWSLGPAPGELIGSDHHAVIATLNAAALPPSTAARRTVWKTEQASDDQHAKYTALVERLCTGYWTRPEGWTDAEEELGGRLVAALSDASGRAPRAAAARWRENAQAAADRLCAALSDVVHHAANAAYGIAVVRPYSGLPPARPLLADAERAFYRTGRALARAPSSAARRIAHDEAAEAYARMLRDAISEFWGTAKAEIESQQPDRAPAVAWKKVKQFLGRGSAANDVSAIRAADGSVATTRAESVAVLTAHYAQQMAPHPAAPAARPAPPAEQPAAHPAPPARGPAAAAARQAPRPAGQPAARPAPPAASRRRLPPRRRYGRLAAVRPARRPAALPAAPPAPRAPAAPAAQHGPASDEHDIWALRAALAEAPADMALPEAASRIASAEEIKRRLEQASRTTAAGPDRITGKLLRLAAASPAYVDSLRQLLLLCWRQGVLPAAWREAHVVPLPKKGSPLDEPGSYRPISLTAILARSVERMVRDHAVSRLGAAATTIRQLSDRLSPWQAGFRPRRSTRQQVLYLHHFITRATRRHPEQQAGVPLPVVFLDISRAFDSVPHELLLLKLWRAGVRGELLHYFRAFLSDRRFRVAAGDELGEWAPVSAGVPQGAVLSPLLYALYIDDAFPRRSLRPQTAFYADAGELLYADDCAATAGSDCPDADARRQQVQATLDALGPWAQRWQVRFSAKKSGCVWFTRDDPGSLAAAEAAARLPPFTIAHAAGETITVPVVPEYQYLGVWLSNTLAPDRQFAHVAAKCSAASDALRAIQSPAGPPGAHVVRTLVNALLRSRIAYALPFMWYTKRQCAKLNRLLLRPLHTALALPMHVHRASLAVYADMPTVEALREAETLHLMRSTFSAARPAADAAHEQTSVTNHNALALVNQYMQRSEVAGNGRRIFTALQGAAAVQREAGLDHLSVFDYATSLAWGRGLRDAFPRDCSGPHGLRDWSGSDAARAINAAARSALVQRPLLEAAGYGFAYDGLHAGAPHGVADRRGLQTAEWLCAPPLPPPPPPGAPRRRVSPMRAPLERHAATVPGGVAPSLRAGKLRRPDSRRATKLRARLTLNRSSLRGAGLNVRANAKRPPHRQLPTHCPQCEPPPGAPAPLGGPAPDTIRHMLFTCNDARISQLRDEWKRKLRVAISRVATAAREHPALGPLFYADNGAFRENEVILHLFLASPFVYSDRDNTNRRTLESAMRITALYLVKLDEVKHL